MSRIVLINRTITALAAMLLFTVAIPRVIRAQTSDIAPRERFLINDGWRFQKGDPEGATTALQYDVRPDGRENVDGRDADARPQEAAKSKTSAQPVLKSWILPTANRLIRDPAQRHARPEGNPGGDVAYVQANFDDSGWRQVALPHDWAIEGPFLTTGDSGGMGRLTSWGIGWYRKKLQIPADDKGKSIFLEVDGAMSYATVWLNGKLVGGWPYGYSSWQVDLTPYILPGAENQLAIRLDNPPNSSRWYPGGGIYRNVWLTKTNPVHVAHWGTIVKTPSVSKESATIEFDVALDNDSKRDETVSVATEIFALDDGGEKIGAPVATLKATDVQIAAGGAGSTKSAVTLQNPRLWGPQKPNRYLAVTRVFKDGVLIDRYETPFGIRSVKYDPNQGVLINGERVALKGVNQHHDLGALGAAFNKRAAERQLETLREMGCNAIRTAHNPPAPELLELTDRLGFLVLDEIFDCWYSKKTPLDFHLVFPDWHEPDLRALVRRDRNCPSVVLWSVGNEVGEQYTGDEGAAVAKQLCEIVHEEDPTRPATSAMNYAKPSMPMPAVLDVISLNYQGEGIRDTKAFENNKGIRTPPQYGAFHERFPDKLILSSETASAFSTRGTYLFPVLSEISGPVRTDAGGDPRNRYVSAYELYAADFGSSPDKVFAALDKHPYAAGEFVWTGWDYLGEPTPYYSARGSYSGIIDLAGFKKDRFYLYQSRWRPELPTVHILPHWTWPERGGQITPVHVFTSGDEVELFLNGKSLGRKSKGEFEYRLRWDNVVYEPGELKAVAYKAGKQWGTDTVQTAGEAAKLEAHADRDSIAADGNDLSFITVRIADEHGVTVPRAMNSIKFDIDGPGEIAATDNGDPSNFESFQSPERKAFNGFALAIVRAKPGQAGTIKISVTSEGLQGATMSIKSAMEIRPRVP
jgi:beta-galactosidase